VIVVGQSLGCLCARAYQRRFPQDVAGMVFVDGTHDERITIGAPPFDKLAKELQIVRHWAFEIVKEIG
jgi:pimeloyl-ACP methyl ester carboxylesterase